MIDEKRGLLDAFLHVKEARRSPMPALRKVTEMDARENADFRMVKLDGDVFDDLLRTVTLVGVVFDEDLRAVIDDGRAFEADFLAVNEEDSGFEEDFRNVIEEFSALLEDLRAVTEDELFFEPAVNVRTLKLELVFLDELLWTLKREERALSPFLRTVTLTDCAILPLKARVWLNSTHGL